MNLVERGQPFAVVVDFAHTPQALGKALDTVRALVSGRVLLAFGLAGGRDVANRPVMGALAARNADFFVITMDDPGPRGPGRHRRRKSPPARARPVPGEGRISRSSSIAARRFGCCSSARSPATPCCWRAKATSSAWSSATSGARGTTRGRPPRCWPSLGFELRLYHDGRAAPIRTCRGRARPTRRQRRRRSRRRPRSSVRRRTSTDAARRDASRSRRHGSRRRTDSRRRRRRSRSNGAPTDDLAPRAQPAAEPDPGLYAVLGLDPVRLRRRDPDHLSPPGGAGARRRREQHRRAATAERRLRGARQPASAASTTTACACRRLCRPGAPTPVRPGVKTARRRHPPASTAARRPAALRRAAATCSSC